MEDNIWTVFTKDPMRDQWAWALVGRGSHYLYGFGVSETADKAAEEARAAYEAIGIKDEAKD